jgi:protein involved in polysaccharide export with SLBB domain
MRSIKALNSVQFFTQKENGIRWSLSAAAGLLFLAVWFAPRAQTQQRNNGTPNTSELALQNLSRVSASAAEIKAVLIKDPGIMVELKRWIAKDATDHGQVIGELELSDYAIFDRLETDVEFRSIATTLVQKYGYILPKLNPDSDLARDQDLLRVERTKWIAQSQEEERSQARLKAAQDIQKKAACDQQADRTCNNAQSLPSTTGNQGQGRQIESLPGGIAPRDQDLPSLPAGTGEALQRAQLMQTGSSTSDNFSQASQHSLVGSFGSSAFSPSGSNTGELSSDSEESSKNRLLAAAFSGANSGMSGSTDGLLAAFGMGMGPRAGLGSGTSSGLLESIGQANGLPPSATGASPLVPMQPNRWYPERLSIEPPEMVRKLSPYENVPSLFDMYMQTVAHPSTPKRFGAEVFENGTHDLQLIPMDLPAGPDYVVGPGDGLTIDLWGGVSTRLIRTVDRGGQISLPEVGPVLVSGKTLAAVQQDLQHVLATQYRDISTGVSLSRLRTIRIYEVGDIINPGAYDISSLSTPLNALFVAGGPSAGGSLRILKHYRGNQLVQTVDVYDLLLQGVKTNIERLENGDTVQVPPIGPQVTIEGMVRRPAIYELKDEKNLAGVLELAGGLLPAATLRHIEVQRLIAHEKQTMLSVDIPDAAEASEATKKLESFEIHDGDRIRIYPIAPYNQDTIYLEGHVVRPGRYSYHSDMRVTDVISSYKDMLPEPATQYAEIIRLNAPDFRPSVESFSLSDALGDPSKAPVLQPMDTLSLQSLRL